MAVTKVERQLVKFDNPVEVTFKAATGDIALDARGADFRTAYLINNTSGSAVTLTINHGDGIQGAGDPIVVSIPANKMHTLIVNSGAYKMVSGDNAGFILAKASASLQIAVVEYRG